MQTVARNAKTNAIYNCLSEPEITITKYSPIVFFLARLEKLDEIMTIINDNNIDEICFFVASYYKVMPDEIRKINTLELLRIYFDICMLQVEEYKALQD